MPLEFEQIRGLFGKKNDIFAQHFALDWRDLLWTPLHDWLISGRAQSPQVVLGDSAFEHLHATRAGPLGKVQPCSVPSALPMDGLVLPLCFSRLCIAAWYLGGIFGQGRVFWPCSLLGFQPFAPKLLTLPVISGCTDRPSAAGHGAAGNSSLYCCYFSRVTFILELTTCLYFGT